MTGKLRVTLLVAAAFSVVACQREELLSVDPGEAPGFASPTLEALLDPGSLESWIDTVHFGFGKPSRSTFMLGEDGSADLTSLGLFRFNAPIQDTVFSQDTMSAAAGFDSLRVVLSVDTARTFLSSLGTTLQLLSVEQQWDNSSTNWEFAVDSPGVAEPWSAGPGGSLGEVLSEVRLEEKPDSIIFDLTAYSDSLLRRWNDTTQENTGLALVVADSGRVVVGIPRLHYNIIPELDPDTSVQLRCPSITGIIKCFPNKTYIFDRSAVPPPAGVLRIGGVDGWRAFTELVIPDSIPVEGYPEPVPLRGATINRADLFLHSLDAPGPPFGAEADFDGTAFEVKADFTVLGPKTPVGAELFDAFFTVDPSVLAADSLVIINITRLIQDWASVPLDSVAGPVRFVLRARPEGTTFGYWEFNAADGQPAGVPRLRVIFTPRAEFAFP